MRFNKHMFGLTLMFNAVGYLMILLYLIQFKQDFINDYDIMMGIIPPAILFLVGFRFILFEKEDNEKKTVGGST